MRATKTMKTRALVWLISPGMMMTMMTRRRRIWARTRTTDNEK